MLAAAREEEEEVAVEQGADNAKEERAAWERGGSPMVTEHVLSVAVAWRKCCNVSRNNSCFNWAMW